MEGFTGPELIKQQVCGYAVHAATENTCDNFRRPLPSLWPQLDDTACHTDLMSWGPWAIEDFGANGKPIRTTLPSKCLHSSIIVVLEQWPYTYLFSFLWSNNKLLSHLTMAFFWSSIAFTTILANLHFGLVSSIPSTFSRRQQTPFSSTSDPADQSWITQWAAVVDSHRIVFTTLLKVTKWNRVIPSQYKMRTAKAASCWQLLSVPLGLGPASHWNIAVWQIGNALDTTIPTRPLWMVMNAWERRVLTSSISLVQALHHRKVSSHKHSFRTHCDCAVLQNQVPDLAGGQQAITLSSGGNDVGLVNILDACIFQFKRGDDARCDTQLQASSNLITSTLPGNTDQLLAALKPKLASGSKIYHTGYAKFLNPDTTACDTVSHHIDPCCSRFDSTTPFQWEV